ncbi:hypothetical protein RZS08_50290, partial [Arthrospira platensis SPKY1]|nr:hypothetical protein [Arthrospira platensis SPKY1]
QSGLLESVAHSFFCPRNQNMKLIQNAWSIWGAFWTARSAGSEPNRDMRSYRVVAGILNIK